MRSALCFALTVLLAGCGDDPTPASSTDTGVVSDSGGDTDAGTLTLQFAARVGSAPFSCAQKFDLGTPAANVEPLDFRLYVHDVRLVRADKSEVALELIQDGKWQYQNVALLDFEDKSGTCANGTADVNTVIRAKGVTGPFTGVKLSVGVPFALNHGDTATAPSPLNLSGLFWSWNSGYKFARIDVRPMSIATGDAGADGGSHGAGAFNIHVGSTGCVGEATGGGVQSCMNPNRGEIVLDGFDPTSKTILVDLATLVEGIDLAHDGGGASGCMSGPTDPECVQLLPRFGLDLANGGPNASAQRLFRVE